MNIAATKNDIPRTPTGDPYGWIDFSQLHELWIHTGTACNLRCPTCFEQAGPANVRLQAPELEDMAIHADAACHKGIRQFGVTGGEPFLHKDILNILAYLSERAPCLVLSNGTEPLRNHIAALRRLKNAGTTLHFRISLDYADKDRHEANRGKGMFSLALDSIRTLLDSGFQVSVARRQEKDEDAAEALATFQKLFLQSSLPEDLPLTAFPDLQREDVPHITENCISTYHNAESCAEFMCAYSRMLAKQNNRMGFYACTLVDDDQDFNYGQELEAAVARRTYLTHKRCFACFAGGVACGKTQK